MTRPCDHQKFPLRKGAAPQARELFHNTGRPREKDNVSSDAMRRGQAFLNRKTTPGPLRDRPFD